MQIAQRGAYRHLIGRRSDQQRKTQRLQPLDALDLEALADHVGAKSGRWIRDQYLACIIAELIRGCREAGNGNKRQKNGKRGSIYGDHSDPPTELRMGRCFRRKNDEV